MELSFCELRTKIVINVYDGKQLGKITDIIIDTTCAKVIGIVVPSINHSKINIFKSCSDIFIPYNHICKIGKDVILVELYYNANMQAQSKFDENVKK